MRHWLKAGLVLALIGLPACNGEGDSKGSAAPKGQFVCQTSREDCIEIFQGTYSGSFSGDASGTFAIYILPDGSIEGVVTDTDGNTHTVTGSVDETGVVVFDAGDAGTFQGSIDFDENVAGTWSGEPGAGSFAGSFVSRDRDLPNTGTASSGSGGNTSTTSTTGSTTAGQSYCDRLLAKAVQCDSVGEGCNEPTTDDERCAAQCLLDLTCEQIDEGDPLFECFARCTAGDERSYCLDYQDKLTECNKEDTLLLLDICGTPGTAAQMCVWDCVLDASCEAFMDEAGLVQSCSSDCGG